VSLEPRTAAPDDNVPAKAKKQAGGKYDGSGAQDHEFGNVWPRLKPKVRQDGEVKTLNIRGYQKRPSQTGGR
jgi:hypothetical protein